MQEGTNWRFYKVWYCRRASKEATPDCDAIMAKKVRSYETNLDRGNPPHMGICSWFYFARDLVNQIT